MSKNHKTTTSDLALVVGFILSKHFEAEVFEIDTNENNFHCDFYAKDSLSTKNFETIEQLIRHAVSHNLQISSYKDEYVIDNHAIKSKGPHGLTTHDIGDYFLLTGISGLHSARPAQRISGIWFEDEAAMLAYQKHMEEIKEYDHRYLGIKLNLFTTDPEITPGMITWLPNGVKVLDKMKQYLRSILEENDYNEVITPPLADKCLWKASGHLEMFGQNMFFAALEGDKSDNSDYALKPMNCPLHVEIFKHLSLSYKQLPYKISEFGFCHRYEASGALHGLFRARGFTQDDAHIFCTQAQIEEVIKNYCEMLKQVYQKFGFTEIDVKLSTRPEKSAGSDEIWAHAEKALANAAGQSGLEFEVNEGDGAFYGPKLDFYIKDSRGRVWQCGTVQLDFVLPGRLSASYVDSDGTKKTPVMVHRAILGSLERFLGVLLEHTKGNLPFWMQPVQIGILSINRDCVEYCKRIKNELTKHKYLSSVDSDEETISYKIRKWWTEFRVPILCIVGNKERDSNTVSLRINGHEVVNNIAMESMMEYIKKMEDQN